MITLNASGGSITFTFSGNSTYLNDGTITVPVNSLALIIDESDMVTFKKSQSSDIFVSANIAEFGMTKDELESWFKANAVGSTGGGGGITSGEVQTMIDESISGKADSSAVTEEISAAVSGKQDTLIAGRGISITTGETADTVSFDLSISAGTGSNSIAEGYNTVASDNYSHAEGYRTSATSISSHAEGSNTIASGMYSHAEGHDTIASERGSHAEGDGTQANGRNSHAEGDNTIASGRSSHAEGEYSKANGRNSHAEGDNTIANNQSEHASGYWNISNTGESTSAQTLFSVGNGGWDDTLQETVRHNAFEIRQNGDIYITKDGSDVKLQDQLGGDITSGDVQTMIDESISGKADSSAVTEEISAAVSGKADTDSLSAYTINEGIASSSQTYDVEVTNDPPVNVYTLDKPYEGIFFNLELNYGQRYLIGYDENDTEIGRFYINAQPGYSPTIYVDTTGFTDVAIYKTILSSSAATVVIEGNEISAIKKFNFYEQYWATDTATTVYFYNNGYNVTDAFKYDLKKLEGGNSISIEKTASAYIISASLPLSAGTGQYSIIEGNGTQASGYCSHAEGQNTTAGGTCSHAEGSLTYAIGQDSHAEGSSTSAMTSYSHVEGGHSIASNYAEHASGHYNVSSSASTTFGDSGNTLFSVGNGNYGGPRHNAFEVRQNGDIYIADTSSTGEFYEKTMIKLQDALGGSSYTAGDGIDITSDVISVTGMVATSAVTSAVTSGSTDVLTSGGAYEQFGGLKLVKLTESEYAALVSKDANTLYVVIPDPTNP